MRRHRLGCCAIYRDEALHLAEWLQFHARAGVEHFFLYDNESVDGHREAIAAALPAEQVTLVPWPGRGVQRSAYQHCLETFGPRADWLAFIDLDEFLWAPAEGDLRAVLKDFEAAPAVVVNGLLFGTSGHVERPPGPVTHRYTWRARETTVYPFEERLRHPGADRALAASYDPMSAHLKCVVQPSRTLRCENPHRFSYAGGALAVTEQGVRVSRNYSETVSTRRLRLHHYWTRSKAELQHKLERTRVSGRAPYDARVAFEVAALMHEVHDPSLRGPLRTVALRAEYAGEDRGASVKLPGAAVQYLSPGARGPHVVSVREGRLTFSDGALVQTEVDARGRDGLFCLTPEGELLLLARGARGRLHHSSLVAGGPVASAGIMRVKDGVLQALSSQSGHYRPPPELAVQVLDWLLERRVSLEGVTLRWL
jgi:hypothetical protein